MIVLRASKPLKSRPWGDANFTSVKFIRLLG